MKTINILWTGGWDSTFRMCELSLKEVIIQPTYVFGDNRQSQYKEIKSMRKIRRLLIQRESTKATINEIRFINKADITSNAIISNAYCFLKKNSNLGSQHDFLARLASEMPNLELCTEKAPLEQSNILTAIDMFGYLVKNDDVFKIDKTKSTEELNLVLGNFNYPIINKNGADMLNWVNQNNFEEIMKHIWVCHNPLFGRPCGICHPCELKIETEMAFVVGKSAVRRYKIKKSKKGTIGFNFKVLKYINRQISKVPNFFLQHKLKRLSLRKTMESECKK